MGSGELGRRSMGFSPGLRGLDEVFLRLLLLLSFEC